MSDPIEAWKNSSCIKIWCFKQKCYNLQFMLYFPVQDFRHKKFQALSQNDRIEATLVQFLCLYNYRIVLDDSESVI